MAKSRGTRMNALREKYMNLFIEFARSQGEDALQISGNAFMFPAVEPEEQEDCFVICTLAIPRGDRAGVAYDGYADAEAYQEHVAKMEEKAVQRAKKSEEEKKKREEKLKKAKECEQE